MTKRNRKNDEPLDEEMPADEVLEESTEEKETEEQDPGLELEEMRKELAACQDKMLRMAADFENTKRRLERDRETSLKFAEENILKELLPNLDNLERALEQGQDTDSLAGVLEGVEMTMNALLETLEKFGVKPVESLGKPFDPNLHEAVAMEASDEFPSNNVLQEFQKGYFYKDRLLRAAKVIVSSGSKSSED